MSERVMWSSVKPPLDELSAGRIVIRERTRSIRRGWRGGGEWITFYGRLMFIESSRRHYLVRRVTGACHHEQIAQSSIRRLIRLMASN